MRTWSMLLAGGLSCTTGLAAQSARQAPVQTRPAQPPLGARGASASGVAGRYVHTDPQSGTVWTLVLDPDGTGTALLNGHLAKDGRGQFVTFSYRLAGNQLFVRGPHTPGDELFGAFDRDSTITTVNGWRYERR